MKRLVASASVCVFVVAACAGGDLVTGDRRSVGVVTVVFSARPARARAGQPVTLAMRLTNNSGRDIQLGYPSAQRFDFWARRNGREVWRWSSNRVFAQSVERVALTALENVSFVESWTPEGSGTYAVFGRVFADGYDSPMEGEVVVG